MPWSSLALLLLAQGHVSSADTTDLWARFAAACPAPADRKTLPRLERALSDSLAEREDPTLYRRAGCVRLEMARQKLSVRKDPVPVGMRTYHSWYDGAVVAMLRAVDEPDPAPDIARAVLATEMMNTFAERPNWLLADSAATLLYRWVKLGRATPELQAACPRLLLAVSDTAAARDCIATVGGDPARLPTVREVEPSLTLGMRVHRLWDPWTLKPAVLATFAYEFPDLNVAERAAEEAAMRPSAMEGLCGAKGLPACTTMTRRFSGLARAPRQLVISWWDPNKASGERWQRDTVFAPHGGGITIYQTTGWNLLAASPTATGWSIAARHNREGVGARAGVDRLTTLSREALFLSDVVIGARDGMAVPFGDDTVWVAPRGTVRRTRPMEVFFQVGSDIALPAATTRITLAAEGNERRESIDVSSVTPVRVGMTGISRQILVSKLKPGRYRLTVDVRDAASGRRIMQEQTVDIRP